MPRLVGSISREGGGRGDGPLRYTINIDRGLRSGKLDVVDVDEEDIIRLMVGGAHALAALHNKRSKNA